MKIKNNDGDIKDSIKLSSKEIIFLNFFWNDSVDVDIPKQYNINIPTNNKQVNDNIPRHPEINIPSNNKKSRCRHNKKI